jgi:hypothetical protein
MGLEDGNKYFYRSTNFMKRLIDSLYSIKLKIDKEIRFIKNTIKDKRVLKWLMFGVTVYGIPAFYRAITKNPIVLPTIESPTPYIPNNLLEKLIVNPIFPGGVGAVAGETFASKKYGELKGLKKYLARVAGSLSAVSFWTLFQYVGYQICYILKFEWPSGGNPFETSIVYPFNLTIALTLAPLVPYLAEYLSRFKYLKKKW